MKLRKLTSLLCAGAMLLCIGVSPIGQARAYTIDTQESADPAPEMPPEVAARYEEHRNHVLSWDQINSAGWDYSSVLIMPGDTFELPVYETDDGTIYFEGSMNTDSNGNVTNDPFFFIDLADDDNWSTLRSDTNLPNGFEVTGTVDNVPERTYTRQFHSSAVSNTFSVRFCEQWVNNTNCPFYLIAKGGGSGPLGDDNSQVHICLQVMFVAPYYKISYGSSRTIQLADLFWRQGDYSDFDFPNYYWITDEQYTFTIPNPTAPGRHFVSWAQSDEGDFTDGVVKTDDYTTFQVKCAGTSGSFSYPGFSRYGDVFIYPHFAQASTITFNGNGGTVKGRDKYVLEVADYDEEPEEFGYALEDYAPVKDGDTFVGWCSKEDTYYDSFVTKDDESVIYQKYSGGLFKVTDIVLYAKWASETEEALEKNGWELLDDGTLWLMDNYGAYNWINASRDDETLAPKVKSIKLGFRGKTVTQIPDGCFYKCVNLTSAEFDDTVKDFGSWAFEGCTGLKTVKFGTDVNVNYGAFKDCTSLENVTFAGAPNNVSQAFFYAPLDVLVKIENGDNEGFISALGSYSNNSSYAYLLNDEVRYPLSVNGELITENNLTVACGGGTATFDPESNTLTLDNAELTSTLTPHFDMELYSAGVISTLPELNVVVKGSLKTVELDAFNVQGDLNITGAGENVTLTSESAYSGKSYAIIRASGKLTINDMTITALNGFANSMFVNNCVLNGGVCSEFNSPMDNLVIKNSTVNQYENDKGTYNAALYGGSVTVENCTLDQVSVTASSGDISVKDSAMSLSRYIIGQAETKMYIINSTVTGKGESRHGMTNIFTPNITLTDCRITKGSWSKGGEFEIKPAGEVTGDTEYKAGPSIGSWYTMIGGDYYATVNRQDDGVIVGTIEKVTVDGSIIPEENYSIVIGGDRFLYVVLKDSYLRTLSNDVHSVEAVFNDGAAKFEVAVCNEIDYSPSVLDENWIQSSGADFTAAIYRDPADGSDFSTLLKDVAIDGHAIDAANYTAALNDSASVNLTIKADFLKTLDTGRHTVTAVFADGKGEFEINVQKDGAEPDPKPTPDPTPDPKPTPDPTPGKIIGVLGDLDDDGTITSADALTILRSSVGLENIVGEKIALADTDGDGSITSADALSVLRSSVGLGGKDSEIGKPVAEGYKPEISL